MTGVSLASPVEPSGASWLINCFLELGIEVAHKPVVDAVWRHSASPPDSTWQRTHDGRYRLHPRADVLKRFLPILSRVDAMRFREDVEVEYVQELATAQHAGRMVICFIRDPRDSLYSAYRRLQPGDDYETFLRFPDPETLLDRPSQWRLWVESWMALSATAWFTFEDYKRDAAALLRRVLDHLQLRCAAEDVERAVAESTFEKARRAEERYRAGRAGDREIANRAGRAGEWVHDAEARAGAALIASEAAAAMRRLGYECPPTDEGPMRISPVLRRTLPIFTRICLPDAAVPGVLDPDADAQLDRLRLFAGAIDEITLRRTNLPNHRIHRLLENLERVAQAAGWNSGPRLAALRQQFVEGSEHHFAQIRELLRQRRQSAE